MRKVLDASRAACPEYYKDSRCPFLFLYSFLFLVLSFVRWLARILLFFRNLFLAYWLSSFGWMLGGTVRRLGGRSCLSFPPFRPLCSVSEVLFFV